MKTVLAVVLLILSTLNPQLSTAFAQGTAFTYQGRLNANGAPVNGPYDLLFTVYPSATGMNDAFANQTNAATVLSNGLFTATLDFGPGIFTGDARWLDIAVRPSGSSTYTNLSPRQKLTATPYAMTAGNLTGSISAGQLSGAIPLAQLPAAVVTNNQSGVNFSGTFTGNGGSLTNLNSATLAGPLTVGATLVSLGHTNDGGAANGVAVSGNFAYVANSGDGLRVYNLANPANPVSIGHINDGGYAWGVAISGNFACVANFDDGLRIYNIANPTNPVSLGHLNDGGQARGVAVAGNFAYVANYDDGLRVYNIANPTNPLSIGHINDGANAMGVTVAGNFAYVANRHDGLRVYNIANPTNPVSSGHIYDGGLAWGVAVSGNFAYLANYDDGLRIYNIANPANPVSIGHINEGGEAWGVAVSGNVAYLANVYEGLRVYNIANPTNPVSIGHLDDGGAALGVAVSGNFAYLANNDDGLRVYGLLGVSAPAFRGDGSLLTGLNADNVTSGILNAARIPNLDASKITTGTIADARLSANVALLNASQNFTGNNTIAAPASLSFGAQTRQMLNLWSTDYGIGVQASAAYFRTDQEFMWYRRGSHSDTFGDAGAGGTQLMRLGSSGSLIIAGTLSQGSDRHIKQDFTAVNPQEVLEKVAALAIETWAYTNDVNRRHLGPVAQDFHAAFGLNGTDDKHIAVVDEGGVALAAIQGLNEKVEEQRSDLKRKETEISELKARLEALEKIIHRQKSE